jgi:site-specific recombinase XerD
MFRVALLYVLVPVWTIIRLVCECFNSKSKSVNKIISFTRVCGRNTRYIYMQEYCIKMYPDYRNSKIILITLKIRKTSKTSERSVCKNRGFWQWSQEKQQQKGIHILCMCWTLTTQLLTRLIKKKVDLRILEILV